MEEEITEAAEIPIQGRQRRHENEKSQKKGLLFLCDKVTDIDYKEVAKIRKYVSERGKILPRRISGNCAKHQRQVTVAIKRARVVALLPYTAE